MKKILLEKFAKNLIGRKQSSLIKGGYGDELSCQVRSCLNNSYGCTSCYRSSGGDECCSKPDTPTTCCPQGSGN